MRYGSITLKSAVNRLLVVLLLDVLRDAGRLRSDVVANLFAVHGPIALVDEADVAARAALGHVAAIAVVDEQLVALVAAELPVEVERVGVDHVFTLEAVDDVTLAALPLEIGRAS